MGRDMCERWQVWITPKLLVAEGCNEGSKPTIFEVDFRGRIKVF
jgi:hypothetical protein